jgi:hypothetical protein
MEKEVEELIRNMGEGISCTGASLEAARGEAGGRSGERGGRGGDFEDEDSSGGGRWDAVCTRGERGRAEGPRSSSRPCICECILGAPRCVGTGTGTGIGDL